MNQTELPIELPEAKPISRLVTTLPEQARVRRPVRNQVEMTAHDGIAFENLMCYTAPQVAF